MLGFDNFSFVDIGFMILRFDLILSVLLLGSARVGDFGYLRFGFIYLVSHGDARDIPGAMS